MTGAPKLSRAEPWDVDDAFEKVSREWLINIGTVTATLEGKCPGHADRIGEGTPTIRVSKGQQKSDVQEHGVHPNFGRHMALSKTFRITESRA